MGERVKYRDSYHYIMVNEKTKTNDKLKEYYGNDYDYNPHSNPEGRGFAFLLGDPAEVTWQLRKDYNDVHYGDEKLSEEDEECMNKYGRICLNGR